jgi:hypothetical protein
MALAEATETCWLMIASVKAANPSGRKRSGKAPVRAKA